MQYGPHGEPEKFIDVAHPFGITPGQIVVDRNDVHAFARQSVQIGRQGGGQGLTLTGFHLCDLALVEHDPADELSIKRPHLQRAHRGFPDGCKGLRKNVVKGFSLINSLLERRRPGLELLIT